MIEKINIMLDKGAILPTRAHKQDAGIDLYTPVDVTVYKSDSAVIDTGVHVEIPEGYAGVLISKSGLNVKNDITSTGLIDSGYTGSIVVKLYNHGNTISRFPKGSKISQLVIVPVETPIVQLVEEFAKTERGSNGFGSTGV